MFFFFYHIPRCVCIILRRPWTARSLEDDVTLCNSHFSAGFCQQLANISSRETITEAFCGQLADSPWQLPRAHANNALPNSGAWHHCRSKALFFFTPARQTFSQSPVWWGRKSFPGFFFKACESPKDSMWKVLSGPESLSWKWVWCLSGHVQPLAGCLLVIHYSATLGIRRSNYNICLKSTL